LAGQAVPPQGTPDRRRAAREAAPLSQLVQGVVAVVLDQAPQPTPRGGVQDAARAAAVRLGVQGARLAPPLPQRGDERETDSEQSTDLSLRAVALVPRGRDTLAQIHRRGAHGSDLLIRRRLLPLPPPSPSSTSSLYLDYP